MCLFTKWILPRKTHNYMTVYKVVKLKSHRKHIGKQRYFSPVMKDEIYLYQPIKATGRKTPQLYQNRYLCFSPFYGRRRVLRGIPPNMRFEGIVYTVEDGYIHCCTSKEYAEQWIKANTWLFPHKRWAILKCIIYPNTLYFKDYSGNQICVRSLVPMEVIKRGVV